MQRRTLVIKPAGTSPSASSRLPRHVHLVPLLRATVWPTDSAVTRCKQNTVL